MFTIKKQLVYLFFISSLLTIKAQNKTIYYGSPSTRGAEIHLSEDNNYNIVLKHGNYDKIKRQSKEYLFLHNLDFQHEGFKVTEDNPAKKTDSITIHFMRRNIPSRIQDIYIGYKEKNKLKYVNLCYETLLFNTDNVKPFGKNLNFKIPRTEHLELLILKNDKFFVDRFKLSPKSENVYVDYRYIENRQNDNSKLVFAEINSTGKFTIIDDLFSTDYPPTNYVKRIASDSIIDWKVPLLVEQEAYKKFENPKLKYQPVTTISPISHDSNFSKFKSLKDAISKLKSDDSKVLLIFNSLLGNNDIHYFNDVFANVTKNATLDYLSDYYLDRYLLYFAKPEDLKELKKYKSEGIQEVIALNSDLKIIYREIIDVENFYYKYNSIDEELSQNILTTNALQKFKKKSDNKTLTVKDFLELGKWRDNDIIKKILEKKPKDESDIFVESAVRIQETRKSDNTRFKTQIDFYFPKINYAEIKDGLSLIIEKHKSDQTIDIDFAKLAFDFISVYPFFEDISGIKRSYNPQKEHYEFCLYLSRFPVETQTIQNKYTKTIDDHFFTINGLLKKEGTKAANSELVIPIFENLVQIEKYKFYTIFVYYFYLYNQDKLLFEDFNVLFKEIIPKSKNYVKQLKAYYDKCENCPYIADFENYMSTLSNEMAWKVVTEHSNDKALLLKALEWSKLSVEIAPEKHYYTDTYGHLEYFLGNKKRAIKLESKAIKLASENDDKNLSEYKKTLEKMKNGTLKY